MDNLLVFIIVAVFAFLYEICDASLGQGYGTLGAPTFILMGFDPRIVVPSILLSQTIGGLSAAFFHHRYQNVDFSNHKTEDIKKVYFIVACGIVGVIIASFVGFKLPKETMTLYIGILVTIMGLLVLSGLTLRFTWKRLSVIAGISAFNKGLSGGGYGPVVTGGQMIIGVKGKSAIAVTDLAEAPICISGFLTWFILQGIPQWDLIIATSIGAGIAPIVGAWITYKIDTKNLRKLMGLVLVILGVLSLFKILNP